ncbi:Major facilitator superfamily [Kalmanozyma brasiliensis GHG001]|uniref:Monocarboxylate transporter n=1 Tax=Kalmanozyma brasiliensis (strain GHG001) TaxID=1365824 RepID=V5EJE5_KALBG|nr:Major facilitator superfamily [Kalmanozyma brasiliensis GHG001]EST04855.1 Major facilitator superfamily [Kalmanozyma brasiliensis GHG001]
MDKVAHEHQVEHYHHLQRLDNRPSSQIEVVQHQDEEKPSSGSVSDPEKDAPVTDGEPNSLSTPLSSLPADTQDQAANHDHQPNNEPSSPSCATTIECSREDANEPIKDRGWAAWKFVLASAATEFMIWGASYGYGSFQDYHQHDERSPFHHASLTATSTIGTCLLAGQHFIPLFTFGLYSMFPSHIKYFTYVCVIGSSLSLLIASFSNSVALVIVFQGLLLGMFGGNLFTTVVLWLPDWWDKKRGFATALIFAGSGIGGIVWPVIFTKLLESVGFRWTLRTWALMQLVISGGAVMWIAPGRPHAPTSKPIRWKDALPGFPRSLLSPITILSFVALVTQTTAYYSVALNISNYATSMGFSSNTSTGILSAFNAAAAVTYFVLGYLVDRFPYPLIMATSTGLNLIFTVLVFGFAGKSLTKLIVYVVFFGITGGGYSSFLAPVSRDIPDRSKSHEFSLRFLYLVCYRGLAAMLGPIIAVQFYPDTLGPESAYGSFGFTGFIAFIAGTLTLSTLASLALFAYKRYLQPEVSSDPVTPPSEKREEVPASA